jgi:class 3 adenylate cyclase
LRARLAALAVLSPAQSEPAQTVKRVSILFLDVVGSTTLSQRLDPEAISAVMNNAPSRGTAIVLARSGRVLQYAGDNFLAAFGAGGQSGQDHCLTVPWSPVQMAALLDRQPVPALHVQPSGAGIERDARV